MKKILKLKDILAIGGKISVYKETDKGITTNSIALSKFFKKNNISLNENMVYLAYLNYSQSSKIQAIYKIKNFNDVNNEECELEEIFNELNRI